ncbi:MAG: hypothetical protein IJ640_09325 [Prevotella sp.]|nr:hypothetical protein [Prevotella sp.]
MNVKLTDKPVVTSMADGDFVVGLFGGKVAPMSVVNFRNHMNDNDNLILNDLAFYIDINSASSLGSTRVDVGGNDHMRQMWEDSAVPVLMDANGNYCELNRKDCRYTAEGEAIVDMTTGALLTKWTNCDLMIIIPQHYGHIQTVTVGATTKLRPWFSLVPLPNGYIIPQMVVGKFKCTSVSGKLRSIPNATPTASQTINAFWNLAQARSKNHGLANLDFRNYLLFHMMSKYGWRDSQNCKGSDGTLVWGVGLDGTEGLASGETYSNNGFTNQKDVKTGHTLSLGMNDGKVAVALNNGNTAHCVNVAGFENPWGQYWEMVQGLCAVGTDVYHWRGNFMPAGTPTAATFDNVEHTVLTRPTSAAWAMNIVANADGQGAYMIPKSSASGISYGDNFSYAAGGQLWLFGGRSSYGADCGLACASSSAVWSSSSSYISARLAYYGDVNKVSPTRLAELAA